MRFLTLLIVLYNAEIKEYDGHEGHARVFSTRAFFSTIPLSYLVLFPLNMYPAFSTADRIASSAACPLMVKVFREALALVDSTPAISPNPALWAYYEGNAVAIDFESCTFGCFCRIWRPS